MYSINYRVFGTIPRLKFLLLLAVSLFRLPFGEAATPIAEDTGPVAVLTASETAARIDQIFSETWARSGVQPAEIASDAVFVRRLYLDLAGRIPSVAEVRWFHDDPSTDRRTKLVDQLLDSPAFVRHFTILWRNTLIPQARTTPELRILLPGFEAWLWTRFSQQIPYDEMVRELVTSPVGVGEATGPVLRRASSPSAFYLARQLQPENLATGMARAFLGVRLDCAQCHDHPFDSWKQEQFWGMAAFFAGFQSPQNDDAAMMVRVERTGVRQILIPTTGRTVTAMFPGETSPAAETRLAPRAQLAEWMTAAENPWFAKMAANSVWSIFMGRGIVHPVDDFAEANPPAHPEILELLADQFVAHDFDLQFLVRTITSAQVYQRSSLQTHDSQSDPAMFARATLRGLTPEQLFDSLAEAVGFYQPYRTENPFVISTDSQRGRFLELFSDEASSTQEKETTILQALAMMNGDFVAEAVDPARGKTLIAAIKFPLFEDMERIEMLYMASLSRIPDAEEAAELQSLLQQAADRQQKEQLLADIFWALLNSSEFLLNH